MKWALASPLASHASLRPAVPFAEFYSDGVHLMFEHFDVLASGGVLRGDDREGLTGLDRSVKPKVLVHLVFDLHGFAVLERDPVQPIAIGFITIARDENWPSLTKVSLTPFSPSSCPLAWSALTARAKRSLADQRQLHGRKLESRPRPVEGALRPLVPGDPRSCPRRYPGPPTEWAASPGLPLTAAEDRSRGKQCPQPPVSIRADRRVRSIRPSDLGDQVTLEA